jgi:hypothetical protein
MFNPDTSPASLHMPSLETAARSLKVEAITAPVHDDVEIETAVIALGREPGGGLVGHAGYIHGGASSGNHHIGGGAKQDTGGLFPI